MNQCLIPFFKNKKLTEPAKTAVLVDPNDKEAALECQPSYHQTRMKSLLASFSKKGINMSSGSDSSPYARLFPLVSTFHLPTMIIIVCLFHWLLLCIYVTMKRCEGALLLACVFLSISFGVSHIAYVLTFASSVLVAIASVLLPLFSITLYLSFRHYPVARFLCSPRFPTPLLLSCFLYLLLCDTHGILI